MIRTVELLCKCGQKFESDTVINTVKQWKIHRKCPKCKMEDIYVIQGETVVLENPTDIILIPTPTITTCQ